MKKIDLNRLEGRQIATANEPQIPYADIEMIALKVNEIIDMLDGISFEKKEEQKPFSVDNPPKQFETYWYIKQYVSEFCVEESTHHEGSAHDVRRLTQNNCFRTKEEAEAALSRVLQALKS